MGKIKPPKLEAFVGMEEYLSETEGVGGMIKLLPEDFIVEEITPENVIAGVGRDMGLEPKEKKEYLHFTLEKNNWDTMRAIKVISERLNVGRKRFGFAGTKDKRAITTQRVSVWNKTIEDLERVRIKDIVLKDFTYSDERINLGELKGNHFRLTIRGVAGDYPEGRINDINTELGGRIPNFFGVQRFGTVRPITHLVGREILRQDFKEAVMIYLAAEGIDESMEGTEARKFLRETHDFREALKIFPKHLGYETAMLNHLVKNPTDFIGAMRKLPKKLRWMFVHAYQSYVYNIALSRYIRDDEFPERLPLIGYGVKPDIITLDILMEKEVNQADFKISQMPELSSEGLFRECFTQIEGLKAVNSEEDELNEGTKKLTVEFSLPKGCYGTSLLRELMKNEYWKTKKQ